MQGSHHQPWVQQFLISLLGYFSSPAKKTGKWTQHDFRRYSAMSWSAHSAPWHSSHCLGSGWLKENRFRIIVEMQKSFTVGENDYDEDGEWEEREMMAFSGKREKMEHWMHNQLTAWSPEHRSSLPSRVDSTVCLMLLRPRKLSRLADCLKKNLLLAIRVRFSIGSLIAHLSFFSKGERMRERKGTSKTER